MSRHRPEAELVTVELAVREDVKVTSAPEALQDSSWVPGWPSEGSVLDERR